MKKLSYLVVAMVIAVATISAANADGFHSPKQLISVTFVKALQIPGLSAAMNAQLDESMLNTNARVYVVNVSFNGKVYRITGTYNQWYHFFHPLWKTKYDKARVRTDR